MKLAIVTIALFIFASCSQKHHDHGHDHSDHHHADHHHDASGGDHHHAQPADKGSCTVCNKDGDEGAQCAECKAADKKAESCCAAGKTCTHKDGASCSAEVAHITTSPKLLKSISQEEFSKVYGKNREQLGQKCSTPAQKYCGKTTKDINVNETEAACLWTKVFRSTRESLPELDGTPCAKMIKGFAKK